MADSIAHIKVGRLVGLLFVALLVACDSEPVDETRIGLPPLEGSGSGSLSCDPLTAQELTLWHSYREDERTALESTITAFNGAHPLLEINARFIPFDAYPDRITAAIPRGRGPDMFIFAHDRVGDWAELGVVEPLNKWLLDGSLLNSFFERTVVALVYKHQLYGLPLAFKSLVLYYNRELIESAPRTVEALAQIARRLTERNVADERFGLAYEYTKLYFHAPWIHGFGGSVLDRDDGVHIGDAASIEALEFVTDLYRRDGVLPDSPSSQSVTSLFNQGRAAMVINGPWFRGEIAEVDYGVAPLPTIRAADGTERPAQPFLTVEALMLSAESDNKNCAFEAIRWLSTDLEAVSTRMDDGHQPVALKGAYERSQAIDPSIAVFREQMLNSVPMPNTPMMLRVWAHADSAIFRAVKDGASAREVLANAQERIESEE